ncbi:DUF2092 domain-containing protein [Mesorhizobium sp. M6A.T.Ce.TU.016.01.1.1]|uniref:DUF2092 domain-containing protein n=1 Tax=Mesorhizobium sp. M6A.T.Ce.TU.016.01.1.1 TaxID=2496783 RepID=UPI000FCB4E1E|nr:DUF2092 domain-containing protein [Mesorhizobium sp. M6A.T.Ce.TU.016.01.1.1]RUU28316.1 DUF2092 domain-containing protein [Mesorhizobium sp. M6A.T.Ce.TU.016.01.1.1]
MPRYLIPRSLTRPYGWLLAGALTVLPIGNAMADDAKDILKAMSDYMAKQKTFSFSYDSSVEVVTRDFEKLQFASSGKVEVARPDKINVSRIGGFADVETVFDGTTLSILGKNPNVYSQVEIKGNLDALGEQLSSAGIDPPGADILASNVFNVLMDGVTDARHISSAYIDGVECEYLAFRSQDVDWQMWIQAGEQPVPRRYIITSKHLSQAPQYTLQTRDWKLGSEVAANDFTFKAPADAKKVDLSEIAHIDEVPSPEGDEQ